MWCHEGAEMAEVESLESAQTPEAVFIDLGSIDQEEAQEAVNHCRQLRVPVLLVLPREQLDDYDPALNPDELIVHPVPENELIVRVKQALFRVNGPARTQLLRVGDMTIDLERYDVTVGGRRVSLTYKEFQLLVLLASNPGRVYSRENLLSQVWGYDYLGGTRTVDVHVRRLRSKIESPDRSFIETIYLVGYRFKAVT